MKFIILLIVFSLSFSDFSQSTKYFGSIYENVYTDFVGAYPLTENQSRNITHYEFNYDKENRLRSIDYFSKYDHKRLFSDILNANRLEFEYEENIKRVYSFTIEWGDELMVSDQFLEVQYNDNRVNHFVLGYMYDDVFMMASIVTFNYDKNGQLYSLTGEGEYVYHSMNSGNTHVRVKLNKNNQIIDNQSFIFDSDTTNLLFLSRTKSEFDKFGNLLWAKGFDETGLPNYMTYSVSSYDVNGFISTTTLYDSKDAKVDYIFIEYIDENEKLVFTGPCETRWVNDAYGNILSKKTYNKDGQPFEDNFGVFEVSNGVDLEKGIYTESYLNAKKEPVIAENGYSFSEIHRDSQGRRTYEKFMDVTKNVMPNDFGVFVVKYEYDDAIGSLTESYFDEINEPMSDNSGAHKYERLTGDDYIYYETAYDIQGDFIGTDDIYTLRVRIILLDDGFDFESTSYFDAKRFPILNEENYFQEKKSYDENWNVISIEYLDTELKPINAIFGNISYAKINYKYDENQFQNEIAYVDADGSPSLDENMISVYKTKYDQFGKVVQIDRYNAELALLNSTMSFATVKYKYDAFANKTEEAYYNAKGELWQHEDGIARYVYEWKNRDNTKRLFYNSKNKATTHPMGVYQIENTFDNHSNVLTERYLNKKGKKMENLDGIHILTFTYNEYDMITSIEIRNKKRKLTMADPLEIGMKSARIVYTYDENGDYSDTLYYDTEGKQLTF